ncbi:prepilin-type N-terminal cleavage/methylation domain-containing protein [bacterium]|nr:prepilin-type N-terminal cleavage/methylation domain-containing protein [bacterium]
MADRKGFTLIELMIVVVIIGILAAISIPMYNRAVDKAKYSRGRIWLKRLYYAIETFYLEHGCYPADMWPDEAPPELFPKYLDEWPSSNGDPFESFFDYEAWRRSDGYWIGVTYLGKDKVHALNSGYNYTDYYNDGILGDIRWMGDDLYIMCGTRGTICP